MVGHRVGARPAVRVVLVLGAAALMTAPVPQGYPALFLVSGISLALIAASRLRSLHLVVAVVASLVAAAWLGSWESGAIPFGVAVLVPAVAALVGWVDLGGTVRTGPWAALLAVASTAIAVLALTPVRADGLTGASVSCGSAIRQRTFTTVAPGTQDATPSEIEIFVDASSCNEVMDDRRALVVALALEVGFVMVGLVIGNRTRPRPG